MSDYNRFVSYMYVYENNIKISNIGFVRVETKDHRCFIYIHMKNDFTNAHQPLKVYMVRRREHILEGILLGDMDVQKQPAEFFYQTVKNDIEHSKSALTDMAGIIVWDNSHKQYGTCWDDDNLDMHTFFPAGQLPAERIPADSVTVSNSDAMTDSVTANNSDTMTDSVTVNNSDTMTDSVTVNNSDTMTDSVIANNLNTTDDTRDNATVSAEGLATAPWPNSMPNFFPSLSGLSALKNTASKKITLSERFERVIAQAEHMYPFEDDSMDACVRLELQDIGLLPVKFWMYAGNSFVLHQYYNYRHLLLCKTHDGRYLLCVPGLHRERDCYMAKNFGFFHFKPIQNKPTQNKLTQNKSIQLNSTHPDTSSSYDSDFGYWYVCLTDDD